jgi:hypothetical protein
VPVACHAAESGNAVSYGILAQSKGKEEVFFFEKKNQKTFTRLAPRKANQRCAR